MSNTAEVTPYVEESPPAVADAAQTLALAVTGVVALGGLAAIFAVGVGARAAASLLTETDEERAARERHLAARSAELLKSARPCELRLRQEDPQSLVKAAEQLGYRTLRSDSGAIERITLARSDGDLLVLSRSHGALAVTSNAGQEAIHTVVQQAKVDEAFKHLQAFSGGAVQVRKTRDGRIELRASETDSGQGDGTAKITVQIDRQGVAHSDIEGIRGNRCEKVLQEFARAVGGQAKKKRIKPEYYVDASAEPARVKTGR